jgi:light-regulated signal transduction histidine kinase (bacteriophytochrome)
VLLRRPPSIIPNIACGGRLDYGGLQQIVRGVIADLELESPERKVVWKLRNLPTVEGDNALLRQVFINLLANALKYTRPQDHAEIEIGCDLKHEEQGNEVQVFVRDNGVGFDPQCVNKLFTPFQRLHEGAEFEGTGIGLANVRTIISHHNGKTWAEARPGEGATFYFSLPERKLRFAAAPSR